MKPILFIFSGLPATGKSTLSKLVAKEYCAAYLRIDTITQGLQDLCNFEVQRESYGLSYRIASDNLKLGQNVVSDCCNPISLTRKEWESVAEENCNTFINIEVLCSNKEEHRKRYETRDAKENAYFTWESLENLQYHSWESERIIIDTANKSIEESFDELKGKIKTFVSLQQANQPAQSRANW
jgi:predicted kinase